MPVSNNKRRLMIPNPHESLHSTPWAFIPNLKSCIATSTTASSAKGSSFAFRRTYVTSTTFFKKITCCVFHDRLMKCIRHTALALPWGSHMSDIAVSCHCCRYTMRPCIEGAGKNNEKFTIVHGESEIPQRGLKRRGGNIRFSSHIASSMQRP